MLLNALLYMRCDFTIVKDENCVRYFADIIGIFSNILQETESCASK